MSNLIPQDFISELLNKIDISDIVGARVKLRRTGSNLVGLCPFHQEKTPSFTVSPHKQFFHCFGCGAHGNAIGFIMQFERLTFVEAVENLAHQVGLNIPRTVTMQKHTDHIKLYQLLDKITIFLEKQLIHSPHAISYLKKRGLSGEICKKFRVGYAPSSWQNLEQFSTTLQIKNQLITTGMLIAKDQKTYPRFRDRIIFPIRNSRGYVIGFGGRTLSNDPAKYLNSPDTCLFHKGEELYGLYETKQAHPRLDHIIVVEGYLDTISLAQFGITNVVATLGTAISTQQINLLLRYTQNILYCFDGDQAGRNAAWRALENSLPLMRDGIQIKFIFLPKEHDPDSLIRTQGKAKWLELLTTATPLTDFLLQHLAYDLDLRTIDGKTKLTSRSKELLQKMPQGIFYQLLLGKIAALVNINIEELQKDYTKNYNIKSSQGPNTNLGTHEQQNTTISLPIQKAISILLHHPYLASDIKKLEKNLKEITLNGTDILLKLVSMLQDNHNLKLGAILENWRDHEISVFLHQLARKEPIIPANDLKDELIGIIQSLEKLEKEKTIHTMLAQATNKKLNTREREILQELIKISKK